MAGPKVRTHVAIQNTKFTPPRPKRRDGLRTLSRAIACKLDRVAAPYRDRGEDPPKELLERVFEDTIQADRMAGGPLNAEEFNRVIDWIPSRLAKIRAFA
jgi:hypothetical protein